MNISIVLAVLTLQNKQQQGGSNRKVAQVTGKYIKQFTKLSEQIQATLNC